MKCKQNKIRTMLKAVVKQTVRCGDKDMTHRDEATQSIKVISF